MHLINILFLLFGISPLLIGNPESYKLNAFTRICPPCELNGSFAEFCNLLVKTNVCIGNNALVQGDLTVCGTINASGISGGITGATGNTAILDQPALAALGQRAQALLDLPVQPTTRYNRCNWKHRGNRRKYNRCHRPDRQYRNTGNTGVTGATGLNITGTAGATETLALPVQQALASQAQPELLLPDLPAQQVIPAIRATLALRVRQALASQAQPAQVLQGLPVQPARRDL